MIYLDNAATSFPKAPGVGQAIAYHLNNIAGNAGRSSYKSAVKSSLFIFELRELIAQIIGVKKSSNIILTNNATQGLNTVILGSIKPDDVVMTTPLEHNSVERPLSYLKERRGISVCRIALNSDFSIDLDKFEEDLVQKAVNKVVFNACSNVTGSILAYQDIAAICYKHDIDFILDASQVVGYKHLNINPDHYSAICFPGHKGLLGPTGTGAFYFNDNFSFEPLSFGGTGSKSQDITQPNFCPDKYESGTLNMCGFYGLLTSLKYILSEGLDKIESKKREITGYFLDRLKTIQEVIIYSNQDLERQIGVISINVEGAFCSQIAKFLDKKEIAIRMGLHCAPNAHRFINTFDLGGTIRFSPGYFTTKEEIDNTINTLKEIIYDIRR